jgi:glycosyltransferase involved in cell wall biosynthesis
MKVYVLLTQYELGGITASAKELATSLKEHCTAEIVYFTVSKEFEQHQKLGISLGVPPANFGVGKILTAIRRFRALMALLEISKAEKIICMDPSSTVIAYFCHLVHKELEVFSTCHVSRVLLTTIDKVIIKKFYQRVQAVIVPSEKVKTDLLSIQPFSNIKVIPNMLPLSACSNSWPNPSTDAKAFLFFGRFAQVKNPRFFLEMSLMDTKQDYYLCGAGPLPSEFQEIIETERSRNIFIKRYQPAEQIMPQSRILILPSLSESFGIVLIEAGIQGIPVLISKEAEGANEIIHQVPKLGLALSLAEPIDTWIDAAHNLSQTPLAAETSRQVLDLFHPTSVIKAWLELMFGEGLLQVNF